MIALPRLEAIVDLALEEDLAGGDLTTESTVSPDARAIGRAIARTPMVACGADVFARVFTRLDPGARVERLKADGEPAEPDEVLWVVEGQAQAILMGERTALNFVQRLSGIATLTRSYVAAIPSGCSARITDTRKTTPGLRALERYAVRCGGGKNHRDALGAGVLIKDNHIALAGGVREAIDAARAHVPHTCRLEIEVESIEQLDEALNARADIVMLDNFAVDQLGEAVRRAAGKAIVEVSGRVGVERIAQLARLGVDVISVGTLTHSAAATDISLEIEGIG
jgi:nicotinate-nucleotide pyrophosphorylase (carboxylating)